MNRILFGQVTLLHFLYFALILTSSFLISRLTVRYLQRNLRNRVDEDRIQMITKTIYYSMTGTALLLAVPLLGVKLSGLAVAGGVAGVVIGFASQNVVSNFISGLFIMMERPIRIGNEVDIGGTEGFVEEIRIMSTLLRTFRGQRIRIPNINVFTSTLINYEAYPIRRVDYPMRIRYRDDSSKALEVLYKELDEEPLVLKHPSPIINVNALGDSSVELTVRFWAPSAVFWDLRFIMLDRLKNAIESNGMLIPYPQRVVWKNEENLRGPVPGSVPAVPVAPEKEEPT